MKTCAICGEICMSAPIVCCNCLSELTTPASDDNLHKVMDNLGELSVLNIDNFLNYVRNHTLNVMGLLSEASLLLRKLDTERRKRP
ncbi:MAG: hypothetical protein RR063_11625 [Anaerovoracaceae bacterium]